eukprot:5781866-Amphidinium_carterae.1
MAISYHLLQVKSARQPTPWCAVLSWQRAPPTFARQPTSRGSARGGSPQLTTNIRNQREIF